MAVNFKQFLRGIDPGNPLYLEPALPGQVACHDDGPRGFRCTRSMGHLFAHAAHGPDGFTMFAMWEDEPQLEELGAA